MATISQRFNTFISNLQLTDKQLKDAITKHTGVRRTLHNAYYATAFQKSFDTIADDVREQATYEQYVTKAYNSYEILLEDSFKYKTSLLIGSYGKNTEITPPSDIDILFELPANLYAQYDSRLYNGQSQLLQDIKAVLLRTYPNTDVKGDGQIVSVPFVTYKIEVLPTFRLTTGEYIYPDTHNGGSWKKSHPRAEKQLLSDSNRRSAGNTIRLIKMIKAWKAFCSVPIKSFLIEITAVNFLSTWNYFDKSAVYYDLMLRDFLKYLITQVNGVCVTPGTYELCYYGDLWESKARTALDRSIKACEYEAANNDLLAAYEWQKIFGPQYNF